MSEAKTRAARSSSRTIVIAVVALLIVVAIAGVVLAGRQGTPLGAAAPTAVVQVPAAQPAVVPAPTLAASAATPASVAPNPNEVRFTPGSDKLPPGGAETISRFAETARSGTDGVRLSTRFLTGENKARDFDLAKARVAAVRHALQADGVGPERVQSELVEVPAGSLDAAAADRVELIVR